MRHLVLFTLFAVTLASCFTHRMRHQGQRPQTPLETILAAHAAELDSVLRRPEYEVQIIYTQIDRDAQNRPSFKTWRYNVDSARYFYPASTVKMPLALLALEKINHLRRSGYPRLHRDTPYRLDSLRAFQQRYDTDPTAPQQLPSIAHDVRQIFAVSDNLAYNHLFEFLGREHINRRLAELGYARTGIVHRFNYPARDNRYASPIHFRSGGRDLYSEPEKFDDNLWPNPQHSTTKGRGYYNSDDSLIRRPFEMKGKNWFALTDMERMLRAVVFPETAREGAREGLRPETPTPFDLTDDDYRFLWHYMGIFPRECDYPQYDSAHFDGYVKFFLYGDSKVRRDGSLRSFNKVGEAYGTLTDVAYVADFEHQVEFILAATVLCNTDGIFNDDRYDYDRTGFPFLAKLGRAIHAYELKRERQHRPDLSKFKNALK